MTDYGLGAIQSPPDERDWPIDALYAASGIEPEAALPSAYVVPSPVPPWLNQGTSPQCTAYSTAWAKRWQDIRDTGDFDTDEAAFFRAIGGGSNGAVLRDAFVRMLGVGYPPNPTAHRIRAYYAVPRTKLDLCAAILAFGPVVIGTAWANSWFSPINGVLPGFDWSAGGHSIAAIGWDQRGLRLRNSWGTAWGEHGDCFLPWTRLAHLWEAWKAVDVIDTAPSGTKYTLNIGARAVVKMASFASTGCITGWTTRTWGSRASSAPCQAPGVRKGCHSGQATIAYVTAGVFKNQAVRIGNGVSISVK